VGKAKHSQLVGIQEGSHEHEGQWDGLSDDNECIRKEEVMKMDSDRDEVIMCRGEMVKH
jgi:hypothetical protein